MRHGFGRPAGATRRGAPSLLAALVAAALLIGACRPPGQVTTPRNMILLVGDGMGLEHVRAAGLHLHDSAGTLSFESLLHFARVTTGSAILPITDSAAAATAMATGHKVAYGVLSLDLGGPLVTVLEQAREDGKSTGLVTTAFITHATPAAFAAHQPSRELYDEIALEMLSEEGPDVLLGGGGVEYGITPELAAAAGYTVVTDATQLAALEIAPGLRVSGQFGAGHLPYAVDGPGAYPDLLTMTRAAVAILSLDPDGFFLMVEGGRIDHASHSNDYDAMLGEMAGFDEAAAWIIGWVQGRADSVLVVTADHETGGLDLDPEPHFTTTGHTAARVGLWAWGQDTAALDAYDVIDNTDVYHLLRGTLGE